MLCVMLLNNTCAIMFLLDERVISKKQACYFSESQKTRLVLNISDLRYLKQALFFDLFFVRLKL